MAPAPPPVLFAALLAFLVPSSVLAGLALRDFVLREGPDRAGRLRRARILVAAAGALPLAFVALITVLSGGGPFVSPGGWAFLGYGAACGVLGLLGAWAFPRAAADPRRRPSKMAETVPLVLLVLNLTWAVNWAPLASA